MIPVTSAPRPLHVPFGDPAGLGLAGFGMTTFVLSVVNAGWVPADVGGVVLGLALFYGGAIQAIAGIWEFANHNTFGAVAFCSYGAFWMSFWYLETSTKLGSDGAKGVGLYLLAWVIFTCYMTIASFRTNLFVFLVFVALTLTYIALVLGAWVGASPWNYIGGYLGVLTALLMVVAELPKTRSGKIMRRLLRDVAENRPIGDVTTLADSTVMDAIAAGMATGAHDD
jgi:succinate-acetate transporter protein